MTYILTYSQEFLHEIKKLDSSVIERILKKLEEIKSDPLQFFERLSGKDEYKLRIGDYRVVANIMHVDKSILLRSIGHRKNIYRK